MSNPFSSKKNGIVEIQICFSTVAKGFTSMEYEWNINAFLLLSLTETEKGLNIVYKRLENVLVPNKIKASLTVSPRELIEEEE